jgi:hypothetical protein
VAANRKEKRFEAVLRRLCAANGSVTLRQVDLDGIRTYLTGTTGD